MQEIENVKTELNQIAENLENGNVSELEVYIAYKILYEALKKQMDSLKSDAIIQMSNYGTGEHKVGGVIVSVANVGGRWDYKELPDWVKAKTTITNIENAHKTAFKSKKMGFESFDQDTGEIVQLPKYSGSSETIKIKIPKEY